MLLAAFFVIFIGSYLNGIALLRRLELAHSKMWETLGRPSLKESNLGAPRLALMRFVWGLHFAKEDDPLLTRYCVAAMVMEVLLAACFIAYVVSAV